MPVGIRRSTFGAVYNLRNDSCSLLPLARTHSINLITEEFLGGYMQDGRMSVVRRFFCLFVTFDLVFVSLLWLICIMVGIICSAQSSSMATVVA